MKMDIGSYEGMVKSFIEKIKLESAFVTCFVFLELSGCLYWFWFFRENADWDTEFKHLLLEQDAENSRQCQFAIYRQIL